MKFVQWDVPELDGLKDSKVYRLRERLNNGDKLTREEKNWLTRNVWECCRFRRGIALGAAELFHCIDADPSMTPLCFPRRQPATFYPKLHRSQRHSKPFGGLTRCAMWLVRRQSMSHFVSPMSGR